MRNIMRHLCNKPTNQKQFHFPLSLSGKRIYLPSTHWLDQNDCNSGKYAIRSEPCFDRANPLEKKTLMVVFLGDQDLLLRQLGDRSRLHDVLCRWPSHLQWINVSRSPPTSTSEHLLIFWFSTCICFCIGWGYFPGTETVWPTKPKIVIFGPLQRKFASS